MSGLGKLQYWGSVVQNIRGVISQNRPPGVRNARTPRIPDEDGCPRSPSQKIIETSRNLHSFRAPSVKDGCGLVRWVCKKVIQLCAGSFLLATLDTQPDGIVACGH